MHYFVTYKLNGVFFDGFLYGIHIKFKIEYISFSVTTKANMWVIHEDTESKYVSKGTQCTVWECQWWWVILDNSE